MFPSQAPLKTIAIKAGMADSDVATATYTITQAPLNYSLVPSSLTFSTDEISVQWTANAQKAKPTDWVSLYKTGDPNRSFDQSRWKYTDGVTSGTFSTTAPNTPGIYEFRYLLEDGYTEGARSEKITVTP